MDMLHTGIDLGGVSVFQNMIIDLPNLFFNLHTGLKIMSKKEKDGQTSYLCKTLFNK